MIVTGRPRVLVPEPDDMSQLVHHDAKLVAVFTNGDRLRAITTTTYI